ncbi:Na+/H+ antiporter subunit E [Pontibacter locisalis]|uniref:Na+/H+ antiporter subunit E n=1 Tax=Pontibacter locisalis TaxID=1719035 RepID=A0ABW5IQV9_9BACT
MRTFLLHTIIAFILTYVIFHQEAPPLPYSAISATFIFLLTFWLFWFTSIAYNRKYFRKMPKAIEFSAFFLKELLVANFKIAYDVVTPHYYMRPTVIALPLKVRSNMEITILANIISLTPGTLSIDVSPDRKLLYIHALYVKNNDVEELKRHIKNGFERRLMELTA